MVKVTKKVNCLIYSKLEAVAGPGFDLWVFKFYLVVKNICLTVEINNVGVKMGFFLFGLNVAYIFILFDTCT